MSEVKPHICLAWVPWGFGMGEHGQLFAWKCTSRDGRWGKGLTPTRAYENWARLHQAFQAPTHTPLALIQDWGDAA